MELVILLLIVKDLDKATKFFKEIFEAKEIYSKRRQKVFYIQRKIFLDKRPLDCSYGRRGNGKKL